MVSYTRSGVSQSFKLNLLFNIYNLFLQITINEIKIKKRTVYKQNLYNIL